MPGSETATPPKRLKEAPPRKPRGPRGQVIIFGLWCKGCRLCVEFCPTGVLAFDAGDRPVVVKPENCTACRWCATHCPDLAIVVKDLMPEVGT